MNRSATMFATLLVACTLTSRGEMQTNAVLQVPDGTNTDSSATAVTPGKAEGIHPKQREKNKGDRQLRRLRLKEHDLKKMGVSEEQRMQITELQKSHRKKMKANTDRIGTARQRLSDLLDQGATEAELEEVIQEISVAQAEQLRILVMNRLEMERILGKETHDQFMEEARRQFKKQERRGTPPLPPRPGFPPAPPTSSDQG